MSHSANTTRRALFGGIAALTGAAALPALGSPSTNTANLSAALVKYDAWTDRLNAGTADNPAEEAEWDRWDKQGTVVYTAIERAPCTPENLRLKARAFYSIVGGDLGCLNEQGTVSERLLVQIVAALAAGV